MISIRSVRHHVRGADASRPGGAAWDAAGRRYLLDAGRHQLVIVHPDGRVDRIGRRGSGIAEFAFPQGLALLQSTRSDAARVFVCDTLNHRVQVFDGRGLPLGAFGGYGRGPGQFEAPSAAAIVTPELAGERGSASPLLAVADRWNGRVQVMTLDGESLACIGTRIAAAAEEGISPEAGWPFFRVHPDPVLAGPSALEWHAPYLDVTTADGSRIRLDLALAMLPTLESWLTIASAAERARAFRYFTLLGSSSRQVSASVLAALHPRAEMAA